MKSNKRNIMSIIICFMMLADICLTFERRSHKKRATKKRTTLELQNPADTIAIDQNNKLMKFVEGLMTGLKQVNADNWMVCLPKSWMTDTEGGQQPLAFNELTTAAQEIAKQSGPIIEKNLP